MEEEREVYRKHGTEDEPVRIDAQEVLDAIADGKDIDIGYADIQGDLNINMIAEELEHTEDGKLVIEGNIGIALSNISGIADFMDASFSGEVDFTDASFNGVAYFMSASFNAGAYFKYVSFNGKAYFTDANFNGVADLKYASFNGKAYFMNASFNAEAYFMSASFN